MDSSQDGDGDGRGPVVAAQRAAKGGRSGSWSFLRRLLGGGEIAGTEDLGRRGERLAARALRRAGYRILGRNIRVRIGEADLLALAPDRRTIVVVEVKTRLRGEGVSALGNAVAPEASVGAVKRRKLLAVARWLARANGWEDRPMRIDVVGIEWPQSGERPTVRHHVGAVGRG